MLLGRNASKPGLSEDGLEAPADIATGDTSSCEVANSNSSTKGVRRPGDLLAGVPRFLNSDWGTEAGALICLAVNGLRFSNSDVGVGGAPLAAAAEEPLALAALKPASAEEAGLEPALAAFDGDLEAGAPFLASTGAVCTAGLRGGGGDFEG